MAAEVSTLAALSTPLVCDEVSRSAVLAAHDPLSLHRSEALRQITDFAARLCGTPTSVVSAVDSDHQTFLAATGFDAPEPPREHSFCAHAMWENDTVIVPDASADPRFANNPLVTGPTHLRFYAGVPLLSEEGYPLGTLCVLDTEPRPAGLTPLQREGLEVLAANVLARLRDSRDRGVHRATAHEAQRAVVDSDRRFRVLADAMPQMVWSTLPDGYHDYYNARWYDFTGAPAGTTDGEGWNGMFHADDQERAWARWRNSLATGDPYSIEYRLRHADGSYRWVLGRALPMRDEAGVITRWFGTCTDIHEQKMALEEREVISQELSHRIKNIFAVIAGLVQFSARARPEFAPAAIDLRQRITALGRAHDFVRPHSAQSQPSAHQDSLHGLLAELFDPYQQDTGDRIVVTGDEVLIDDRAATPIALMFHELATNATKYGALSADGGHVAVTIADNGQSVSIGWRETGGPEIAAPALTTGFGSQLIELSAVRQLGGTVTRDWHREGLAVTLIAPTIALSRAART